MGGRMAVRVRWGAALALGWVAACEPAASRPIIFDGAAARPERDAAALVEDAAAARDAARPDRASPATTPAPSPDAAALARDGGGDPFASPPRCTSGTRWSKGNGELMAPGQSCLKCHPLTVGGTVYPTGHEPDDCNGAAGSVQGGWPTVVIVDANGGMESLSVNQAGNFSLDHVTLVPPLRVKVVFMGRERAMLEPAPDGDCNACHTEAGDNKAPGRIVVP
jgi:hypothetical protein